MNAPKPGQPTWHALWSAFLASWRGRRHSLYFTMHYARALVVLANLPVGRYEQEIMESKLTFVA